MAMFSILSIETFVESINRWFSYCCNGIIYTKGFDTGIKMILFQSSLGLPNYERCILFSDVKLVSV